MNNVALNQTTELLFNTTYVLHNTEFYKYLLHDHNTE